MKAVNRSYSEIFLELYKPFWKVNFARLVVDKPRQAPSHSAMILVDVRQLDTGEGIMCHLISSYLICIHVRS